MWFFRDTSQRITINTSIRHYILASLFAALTAAGAFIKVPIPPVPFTLQTFFVMLAGVVLGPGYGALSQIIYLITGLLGAPIFSMGGGPGYVLQPTFGYLLSYPIAAYVIGLIVWGRGGFGELQRLRLSRTLTANTIGTLIIFVMGVLGLYLNAKLVVAKALTFSQAFTAGFLIFIPSSILKIVVCSAAAMKMSRVIKGLEPVTHR